MKVTSFRAVWLVPERRFVDAAPLLDDVDGLLDVYLREERLSCCSVQGWYFVDVDGVPWSDDPWKSLTRDDGTVDEPHMTNVWFFMLRELLAGATHTGGMGPWEQSQLVIERRGATVVMVDGPATKDGRPPAMRRLELPFAPFFLEVIAGGRVFRGLSARLREAVAKRRVGASTEITERLDVVVDNVFHEGDLVDLDDLEAKLRAFSP